MTLEARLSYLMDRPALDHNMAELPSRYGCPSLTYNRDWYFFHNEKKGQWEHLTGGDVLRYRNKLVEYLRTVEREGGKLVWEDGMDSHVPSSQRRGLIFTAGDGVSSSHSLITVI
jgi:alpha 1,2-mannosyltransferase